ncbi:MAG: hypothetical protein KF849_01110 [Rhizobiaceae bacterium]|nr:hypothetical protein [Rhizobiaceae bacterium]
MPQRTRGADGGDQRASALSAQNGVSRPRRWSALTSAFVDRLISSRERHYVGLGFGIRSSTDISLETQQCDTP